MPDRHAGTPRCLHAPERRERVVSQQAVPRGTGRVDDFALDLVRSFSAETFERCLDCRAIRRLVKQRSSPPGQGWGPWISAGAQVKAALLGQGQSPYGQKEK